MTTPRSLRSSTPAHDYKGGDAAQVMLFGKTPAELAALTRDQALAMMGAHKSAKINPDRAIETFDEVLRTHGIFRDPNGPAPSA